METLRRDFYQVQKNLYRLLKIGINGNSIPLGTFSWITTASLYRLLKIGINGNGLHAHLRRATATLPIT